MACMVMIGRYWGLRTDLLRLRQDFGAGTRGISMKDIIGTAASMDLTGWGSASDAETPDAAVADLRHVQCPAILHFDMNHWVVLKKVSMRGRTIIHDPAIGVRKLTRQQLHRSWTGGIVEFSPNDQFASKRDVRVLRSWHDVLGNLRGVAGFISQMLSLTALGNVAGLVLPYISQQAVDNVAGGADTDLLTLLVVVSAGVGLSATGLEAFRSWTITVASMRFSLQWRARIFDHMLKLPLDYFQKNRIGNVAARLNTPDQIIGLMNNNFVESFFDVLMAALLSVVMVYYSSTLFAVALAGCMLYCAFRILTRNVLRNQTQLTFRASARRQSHMLETVRSIRAIKLGVGEQERLDDWRTVATEETNAMAAAAKYRLVFSTVSGVISTAETSLIFWMAYSRVISHELTIGAVVAFTAYRAQFYSRVVSCTDNLMDLKQAGVWAERLADLWMTPEEPGHDVFEQRVGEVSGDIELRGVSFSYSTTGPKVLDNISLRIGAGETVAIIGASGCGKSTLLALLTGLIQPSSGEVLLGGHSIASLGARFVRNSIGCVSQSETVQGRIEEAIAGSRIAVDRGKVVACAQAAAIHEDILAMPLGYSTTIGDLGGTLSGGQLQRLCIARALYRDPKVLLLDEATSHLDTSTETRVNAAIRGLGNTRIIVAHRFETILSADRVVELQAGKIIRDLPIRDYLDTRKPQEAA